MRGEIRGNILWRSACDCVAKGEATHEVGEMNVAVGIQQHVVRLDVPVHDTLGVYVADSAAQFGYPEAHGVLGESLARDVETEVAAVHQIDDDVSVGCQADGSRGTAVRTYRYSISWKLYRKLHRKGWFRCSSMRRSRMMLRTLSDRTTVTWRQRQAAALRRRQGGGLTLILPDVLEGKGQAGVLPLDDADLAEGSLADYTQQPEVVEIHWGSMVSGPDGCGGRGQAPWSVKTTGFPLL